MTRQDGPDERDREFLPGPVTIIEWPAHCLYCRTSFLSLDAARAHDATCPQHPAVQEAEKLNRLIVQLNATIIEHDRQNDDLLDDAAQQLAEAEAHAREVTRLLAECCTEKADLVEKLAKLKPVVEAAWDFHQFIEHHEKHDLAGQVRWNVLGRALAALEEQL